MWSLGLAKYEEIAGNHPFYDPNHRRVKTKVMACIIRPSLKHSSQPTINDLAKILAREPADRTGEPRVVLQEPFFTTMDLDQVPPQLQDLPEKGAMEQDSHLRRKASQ